MKISKISMHTFLPQSEYKHIKKSPKFKQIINSFRKTVMDSNMNEEFQSAFYMKLFASLKRISYRK